MLVVESPDPLLTGIGLGANAGLVGLGGSGMLAYARELAPKLTASNPCTIDATRPTVPLLFPSTGEGRLVEVGCCLGCCEASQRERRVPRSSGGGMPVTRVRRNWRLEGEGGWWAVVVDIAVARGARWLWWCFGRRGWPLVGEEAMSLNPRRRGLRLVLGPIRVGRVVRVRAGGPCVAPQECPRLHRRSMQPP